MYLIICVYTHYNFYSFKHWSLFLNLLSCVNSFIGFFEIFESSKRVDISESFSFFGFKNKQIPVKLKLSEAFKSVLNQKNSVKMPIRRAGNNHSCFFKLKNLIFLPLNLSSQDKSPIPARNLIYKVNKVWFLGQSGY